MEPTMTDIPEKLFYKAAEVCQITDTQPYVLRFWESEFPQLASEKNRSGQRVYRRQDIDLVFRIKKLLYQEEYTIAGARKAIDEELTTVVEPAPSTGRSRRVPATVEPEEPAAQAAHAEPPPLFGEPHSEIRESQPTARVDAQDRYRALYEEAAAALTDLRERNRRLAERLQASLEN